MRKAVTRDKINRTFTEHSGSAIFYNRKTGKKETKKYLIYTDRKDFEVVLQNEYAPEWLLLQVKTHSHVRKMYSMTPEDFRKYATIY